LLVEQAGLRNKGKEVATTCCASLRAIVELLNYLDLIHRQIIQLLLPFFMFRA
jgi:hypothetical protein